MEIDFVRWLQENLPPHPCLSLGIGDDAAGLSLPNSRELVATTDLLVAGVHFDFQSATARQVGYKALGVNLSDIAAMAASPVAALISIAVPRDGAASWSALELAKELFLGMLPLAEQFDVALAGGDTNTWNGPLVINAAVLGELSPKGPLTRSGGRPGDRLLVTGSLGGSILGRHLSFVPRLAEALLLHERYVLHAGMDISDGLSLDLARLAAASSCGAIVDVDRVPVSDAAYKLGQNDEDALRHALSDGEDFELLLAVPADAAKQIIADQPIECPITDVGELTVEAGLQQRSPEGKLSPLESMGYVHRS